MNPDNITCRDFFIAASHKKVMLGGKRVLNTLLKNIYKQLIPSQHKSAHLFLHLFS